MPEAKEAIKCSKKSSYNRAKLTARCGQASSALSFSHFIASFSDFPMLLGSEIGPRQLLTCPRSLERALRGWVLWWGFCFPARGVAGSLGGDFKLGASIAACISPSFLHFITLSRATR